MAVLAVGNYLNSGTTNGGAAAFKMHALTKLQDTKSIDGDETLLSFLATTLLDSDLAPLADEIPSALGTKMQIAMEARPCPLPHLHAKAVCGRCHACCAATVSRHAWVDSA